MNGSRNDRRRQRRTETLRQAAFAAASGSVTVEEDGETVITIMPKRCTRWECQVSGKNRTLENRKGLMVCPVCGGSYGRSLNSD